MTTTSLRPGDARPAWRTDAVHALQRLGAASLVGALGGLVVGGIGGRLFMGLLAGLNREDHGVITSDGFPMGEVTLAGTLNLLAFATVLGVLGAGVYLALRGLLVGPRWFARACTVVGGTVMVGTVMVHEDGPDFTLLEPTWAAIALTLSVPLVYLLVVPPLVDRAVRRVDEQDARRPWLLAGLAPWVVPLLPVAGLLVAGWVGLRAVATHGSATVRRAAPWAARAVLVVLFGLGLANLVGEVVAIYDTVGDGRYVL
jgi:hypothetical protein